jgi:hypothetical protein
LKRRQGRHLKNTQPEEVELQPDIEDLGAQRRNRGRYGWMAMALDASNVFEENETTHFLLASADE